MRKLTGGWIAAVAALALAAGCTIKKDEAPPLSGPSELGLAIQLSASPDVLHQDGASQSLIRIETRGPDGAIARNTALRAEISLGGVLADFGRLSARNLVTDNDGRATLIYTAPPFVGDPVDNGVVVTILVTPAGTDFRNAVARQLDIRLVPPGVILPPNGAPTAQFSFSPVSPSTFQNVNFDASASSDPDGAIVSYAWDFGDGSSGTGRTAQHQYRTGGSFNVTLTVTDDRGLSDSESKNVNVTASSAPTAAFTFSPTAPGINQDIVFNGAASRPAAGRTIVRYEWNFGSGSPQCCGAVATKSYDVPGTYNVTLTVTDDADAQGTATQAVTVSATGGQTPTATFTISPTNPITGQPVFFNASAASAPGSTIVSYAWDFGDGATGSGQTTSHTYATPFTYVVRLTVTDSAGRVGTATQTLTVTAPAPPPTPTPTASFIFSPAQPNAGQTVFFDASASAPGTGATITSYSWSFGDGSFGTGVTPQHTYAVNGAPGATTSYNVRLTVTNSAGQSATATQTVAIKNP
jgi:PKD repeat protein